jgi:hypothetical protein
VYALVNYVDQVGQDASEVCLLLSPFTLEGKRMSTMTRCGLLDPVGSLRCMSVLLTSRRAHRGQQTLDQNDPVESFSRSATLNQSRSAGHSEAEIRSVTPVNTAKLGAQAALPAVSKEAR